MHFGLSLVVQLPNWASITRSDTVDSLTTSPVGCLALGTADYICRLPSLDMLSLTSNFTATPFNPIHTCSHTKSVQHEVRSNPRYPGHRCQRSIRRSPAAERQRKQERIVTVTTSNRHFPPSLTTLKSQSPWHLSSPSAPTRASIGTVSTSSTSLLPQLESQQRRSPTSPCNTSSPQASTTPRLSSPPAARRPTSLCRAFTSAVSLLRRRLWLACRSLALSLSPASVRARLSSSRTSASSLLVSSPPR